MSNSTYVRPHTDVFAPPQVITSAVTKPYADVFARRERRPMHVGIPPMRRLAGRFFVNDICFEFTSTTFDDRLPCWVPPMLQSLAERWGARPGWDGYQAIPTNPRLVEKLLNILLDLLTYEARAPHVTPLADGGFQAEWHSKDQDLEIVASAYEEPTYYYFNGATNTEEEADLDANYARVQYLIGQVG